MTRQISNPGNYIRFVVIKFCKFFIKLGVGSIVFASYQTWVIEIVSILTSQVIRFSP